MNKDNTNNFRPRPGRRVQWTDGNGAKQEGVYLGLVRHTYTYRGPQLAVVKNKTKQNKTASRIPVKDLRYPEVLNYCEWVKFTIPPTDSSKWAPLCQSSKRAPEAFYIILPGSPADNHFVYCPFCGNKIRAYDTPGEGQ